MRSKPILSFKPIDLSSHAELAVMFKIDSFVCNFGTAEKFGKRNGPKAQQYVQWLQKRLSEDAFSMAHVWLGDELVGQVELSEFKDDSVVGYVNLYYLIPGMRGLGLGDQLDAYAMKYFQVHDYKKALLSVSQSNLRALKFYKRLGWRIVGDNPEDPELSMMERSNIVR